MTISLRHTAIGLAALCLTSVSPATRAANGDGWDWMIAPYGWFASIGTDLNSDEPPAGTDSDFSDIVDKIDGAFEAHLEGQGDEWGLFADFTWLSLADDNDRRFSHTESDLDAYLVEAAAVWSPGDTRNQGWELFAGVRYIDINLEVDVDPVNPAFDNAKIEAGQSYSDLMLGARYTWDWTDRWGVTFRGDGSFGDTEGTWNASVVGHYRTAHGAWLFGYRYLSAEFKTGAEDTELTMNGPILGYGFVF